MLNRTRLLLILVCAFCTPGALPAQDLAERLEARMQRAVAENDFSGSVLVARDGIPLLAAGYGYGWSIGKKNGRRCISHGGGIHGFVTEIDRYTDDRATVIVLCNSMWSEPREVANELAGMLFAGDGN